MKGQTVIIILLGLIVAKLYPSISSVTEPIYWIILVVFAIAFLIVGGLWTLGFIGNWIDGREQRKIEKMELKTMSKTIKDIDHMQKRISKLK